MGVWLKKVQMVLAELFLGVLGNAIYDLSKVGLLVPDWNKHKQVPLVRRFPGPNNAPIRDNFSSRSTLEHPYAPGPREYGSRYHWDIYPRNRVP